MFRGKSRVSEDDSSTLNVSHGGIQCLTRNERMSQHIWYLFSVYTVVSITGLYILYENTDGDNGGLDGKAIKGEQ